MCSADLKPGTTAQRRKRSVPATRLPQAPHKKEPRASVEGLDAGQDGAQAEAWGTAPPLRPTQ
jgi:hypothetical protein